MRLGGVGRAAVDLGVTHGAVSRQIAALEERLRLRLFDGPRNARRPTAEAESLYAEIAGPMAALDVAMARRAPRPERLTVSCLSTLATRWLIPRLADFAAQEPGMTVELRESYAPLARTLEGCDLAIRMQEPDDAVPAGLVATAFMANAVGLVVAPGADPEGPRLVSRSHPAAWMAWREYSGRSGPTDVARSFDHQQTMIEATIAGLGVCVAQRPLVQADIAAGRLVAPYGFLQDDARFTAFARLGFETRAVRRFLDWLILQGRD